MSDTSKYKIDWSKTLRSGNPKGGSAKITYLGPQTLRDGKPIADAYVHLVLFSSGQAYYVDGYGYGLPVGKEPSKQVVKNIEEPRLVPHAPVVSDVTQEWLIAKLQSLAKMLDTTRRLDDLGKQVRDLADGLVMQAAQVELATKAMAEVREQQAEVLKGLSVLLHAKLHEPPPPPVVEVAPTPAAEPMPYGKPEPTVAPEPVAKPKPKPVVLKDFSQLDQRHKATLDKIADLNLRNSVRALFSHEAVRNVSLGITRNVARKGGTKAGEVHYVNDKTEYCIAARGVEASALIEMFIYHEPGRRQEVLEFLKRLPLRE